MMGLFSKKDPPNLQGFVDTELQIRLCLNLLKTEKWSHLSDEEIAQHLFQEYFVVDLYRRVIHYKEEPNNVIAMIQDSLDYMPNTCSYAEKSKHFFEYFQEKPRNKAQTG